MAEDFETLISSLEERIAEVDAELALAKTREARSLLNRRRHRLQQTFRDIDRLRHGRVKRASA